MQRCCYCLFAHGLEENEPGEQRSDSNEQHNEHSRKIASMMEMVRPAEGGEHILKNGYWTWPTHGPNNYELMDVRCVGHRVVVACTRSQF